MKILDERKTSLMMKKPSGTISISGNLSEFERKFYNALLYVAEKQLMQDKSKHMFSMELVQLKRFFGLERDKNNRRIKEIIRNLSDIKVEYNILQRDRNMRIEGFAHLLDNIEYLYKDRKVMLKFSIPEIIRETIQNKNSLYASIDLIIMKGLTSKYSIILYELLKDFRKDEIITIGMKEFRKIFGVENKYKFTPNLRKRVLNPACEELNANSKIDFFVEYKLLKTGTSYTHIQFTKKPKLIPLSDQIAQLVALATLETDAEEKEIEKTIKNALKNNSYEYVKAQIEYVNSKKPDRYITYLKQAIKNNYAGSYDVE